MILRSYQRAAVNAVADLQRGLIAMPTGTGKTVVFAELARLARGRVMVLAHRTELLDQAIATIAAHTGSTVGRIQAGECRQERITVASVASLHERTRAMISRPALLVIDEAHHTTAPTYRAVIEWAQCRTIGVTATPFRLDEGEGVWELGQVFGDKPAYSYPLMDAVRDGHLVPIRQWGVQTASSLDGCAMRAGDLAASGLISLDCPERNILVADSYRRLCAGRRAIVFAVGVAHAQNLAVAMLAMDIRARAIWADDPNREDTIAAYRRGELDAVVNCGILTEGFDDPETSALLMARPTTSRGLYVQMAGRGLRPAPDKADCVIVDFLDAGKRHSLTVQSAVRLAGIPGTTPLVAQDAKGRRIIDVADELMVSHLASLEDMRERLAILPLSWAAKDITPRWSAEQLSLAGYQPTQRWELRPATSKQVKTIERFRFRPERDLTRGEASALIDRLFTLDAEAPEMATPKQIGYLRWRGLLMGSAEGITKRDATRMIARSKAG